MAAIGLWESPEVTEDVEAEYEEERRRREEEQARLEAARAKEEAQLDAWLDQTLSQPDLPEPTPEAIKGADDFINRLLDYNKQTFEQVSRPLDQLPSFGAPYLEKAQQMVAENRARMGDFQPTSTTGYGSAGYGGGLVSRPEGGFSPYDDVFRRHAGDLADNDEFIAIVAAGTKAESGWNPNAVGDNGESVGLFQMHARGAGAGMGKARADPDASSAVMVPQYARHYKDGKAKGLSGAALASYVARMAERPSGYQDPNGKASQNYMAAYQSLGSGVTGGPPGGSYGNEPKPVQMPTAPPGGGYRTEPRSVQMPDEPPGGGYGGEAERTPEYWREVNPDTGVERRWERPAVEPQAQAPQPASGPDDIDPTTGLPRWFSEPAQPADTRPPIQTPQAPPSNRGADYYGPGAVHTPTPAPQPTPPDEETRFQVAQDTTPYPDMVHEPEPVTPPPPIQTEPHPQGPINRGGDYYGPQAVNTVAPPEPPPGGAFGQIAETVGGWLPRAEDTRVGRGMQAAREQMEAHDRGDKWGELMGALGVLGSAADVPTALAADTAGNLPVVGDALAAVGETPLIGPVTAGGVAELAVPVPAFGRAARSADEISDLERALNGLSTTRRVNANQVVKQLDEVGNVKAWLDPEGAVQAFDADDHVRTAKNVFDAAGVEVGADSFPYDELMDNGFVRVTGFGHNLTIAGNDIAQVTPKQATMIMSMAKNVERQGGHFTVGFTSPSNEDDVYETTLTGLQRVLKGGEEVVQGVSRPEGSVTIHFAPRTTLSALGAAAGAATAEEGTTPEERVRRAAAGAVGGFVGGPLLVKAVQKAPGFAKSAVTTPFTQAPTGVKGKDPFLGERAFGGTAMVEPRPGMQPPAPVFEPTRRAEVVSPTALTKIDNAGFSQPRAQGMKDALARMAEAGLDERKQIQFAESAGAPPKPMKPDDWAVGAMYAGFMGPATVAVNALGGLAVNLPLQFIRHAGKQNPLVTAKEFMGMINALPYAAENAVKAWKLGYSAVQTDVVQQSGEIVPRQLRHQAGGAGAGGFALETINTLSHMADQIAFQTAFGGELARRTALRTKGTGGSLWGDQFSQALANPNREDIRNAWITAEDTTLRGPMPGLVELARTLLQEGHGPGKAGELSGPQRVARLVGREFVPFFRTIWHIGRQGYEMTPAAAPHAAIGQARAGIGLRDAEEAAEQARDAFNAFATQVDSRPGNIGVWKKSDQAVQKELKDLYEKAVEAEDAAWSRGGVMTRAEIRSERVALGSALWLAAVAAANKGWVTGALSTDRAERDMLEGEGIVPMSIKVGDKSIPYSNWGPIAVTLGTAAGFAEALKLADQSEDEDQKKAYFETAVRMMAHGAASTAMLAERMGYLQQLEGINTILDIQQGNVSPDLPAKLAAGAARRAVPFEATLATIGASQDPYRRFPSTLDGWDEFFASMKARSPAMFLREDVPPVRNPVTGEPVPNPRQGVLAYLPISVVPGSSEETWIMEELGKVDYRPSRPGITAGKTGAARLENQERDAFYELAGALTVAELYGLLGGASYHNLSSDEKKREAISRAVSRADRAARKAFFIPEMVREAEAAKSEERETKTINRREMYDLPR